MVVGLVSATRSKYAQTAAARFGVLGALVELLFGALLLIMYLRTGGFSTDSAMELSPIMLFGVPALGLCFILLALFETKRAPFDHTEAESELVAGHLVEFGGRTLLVFFICEYVHVYFCVFSIVVFAFNG